jgi:Lecithin retinol acyltransferase
MNNYIPQIGDVVKIDRGLYQHVGVYVGAGFGGYRDVVHNDKSQGVIFSTLAEFSSGAPVLLHRQAVGNWWQRRVVANRAISLVGRKYNLWNFNCEHLATWSQTGNAESPQLAVACFFLLAGALGLLLIRSKE